MKVLTIKQPWIEHIRTGLKTQEFRSWKTEYRGPLLLHASASRSRNERVCFAGNEDEWKGLRRGCIVLRANLKDILEFTHVDHPEYLYAWLLTEVAEITPIPISGRLGLWNYPYEH